MSLQITVLMIITFYTVSQLFRNWRLYDGKIREATKLLVTHQPHTHTKTHTDTRHKSLTCPRRQSNVKKTRPHGYMLLENSGLTVVHSWFFSVNTIKLVIVSSSFICMYLYIFIYIKLFETSGLPLLYRVSSTPPSVYRTKLERDSIRSSIVVSAAHALYFSMWNNTKRWPMYIMLSIEATVYVDSNDKYSSIFKISETKSWDYYQNLNIVLSIYRCFGVWYQGVCRLWKCPVLSLTRSVEQSVIFFFFFFLMLESLHRKKREHWSERSRVRKSIVFLWSVLALC